MTGRHLILQYYIDFICNHLGKNKIIKSKILASILALYNVEIKVSQNIHMSMVYVTLVCPISTLKLKHYSLRTEPHLDLFRHLVKDQALKQSLGTFLKGI